jgi:hypothetical protein
MSGRSVVMSGWAACVSRPLFAPAGTLAWAVGLLTFRPGWAEAMLLLASLVGAEKRPGVFFKLGSRFTGPAPWEYGEF